MHVCTFSHQRHNTFILPVQELIDEGAEQLHLSKDTMDRALMARLMMDPAPGLQSPFFYLLDMYARASAEYRSAASLKDKDLVHKLQDVANYAQELAISHANLALTMDLFPEVRLHGSDLHCDQIGPCTSAMSSLLPQIYYSLKMYTRPRVLILS